MGSMVFMTGSSLYSREMITHISTPSRRMSWGSRFSKRSSRMASTASARCRSLRMVGMVWEKEG